MEKTIIIVLFLISALSFGQKSPDTTIDDTPHYSENSEIEINYSNSTNPKNRQVAVFINGVFQGADTFIKTLNPDKIKHVNIEKGEFKIDGKDYSGKLLIDLKPDYTPSLITLNDLISKHLTLDENPITLQIDGSYVNQGFSDYIVDEKFILNINVSSVNTAKIGHKVNVINIYTKSIENIKNANKPKKIIIRGTK